MGIIQALKRAEADSRVKAMLIRLPEGGLEPAAADELRLAIKSFRAAGKPVFAHSQGLYPSGISTATYMVGAAADQLWMQPASSLQSTGIASEDVFLKRLFDKYGVQADFQQRYEYKNAVNPLLYSDYTDAHRESELAWMGSVYGSTLDLAAADRRLQPASLRATLEAGPYSAEDAKARGLIDKVGQLHDAETEILARAGKGAELLDINDYRRRGSGSGRAARGKAAIAVITAEGEIVTGKSDNRALNQQSGVFSDDVAQAFYDAIKDDEVKAIVFRISSPGGSDTASEQILAAVRAARAAKKPVVVSMGTYAASGGYWIASQADEIIAQPTTLTGSIGVFGGKIVVGDALARYGVDMRGLSVGGEFAGAYANRQPFTAAQRTAISAWMDRIYEGFVARVAEGRKLSPERVREIAKGRVWTGAQAKELGLVDKIGGFYLATAEAKRLGGLQGTVRLKLLPVKKSPFEVLERVMGVSADGVRVLAAAGWVLGDPRAKGLMDELAHARLPANGGMVLAPTPLP